MTAIVIDTGGMNHLLRIDEVWMFISVDAQGNEGVCAAPMGGFSTVPLIAADEARLVDLRIIAARLAALTPHTIKLIKLSTREDLETIAPAARP